MAPGKKKITSFLLLLCLAAPVFFYAVFIVKQHSIRSSMKKQLKQQMLQTVTVAKNALAWFDDGKEVSINGKMFDLVTAKEEGDSIILTGLYDTDEDKLHESLNAAMQHKNKQQPANNLLLKIASLQAAAPDLFLVINLKWIYIKPVKVFYLEKIPSTPSAPILHPPQA